MVNSEVISIGEELKRDANFKLSSSIKKATVLGGGAFGMAMAHVLGRNGVEVTVWAFEKEVCEDINNHHKNDRFLKGVKLPKSVKACNDFAQSLQGAELVLIVIPAPFLRQTVCEDHRYLPVGVPIVCCTKGIENSSLLTPYEILIAELPGKFHGFLGVLSGPSFAIEVAKGLPTSVLVAAKDSELAEEVQRCMSDVSFRVYTGTDIMGAEICGAMKNVIAIACGFASGLNLGNNTAAMLITRGLSEMSILSILKGGNPGTMSGLAGMGDLVLTCSSTKSRNFTVGMRLAKGETIEEINGSMREVAEGVKTSKSIQRICDKMGLELPLCSAVYGVIWGETKDLKKVFEEMARLPLEPEFNPFAFFHQVQLQHQSKI